MRKMFHEMRNRLEKNEDLMLVTVVASSGATPRGAGARMLVGREGRIHGTVGGGAVEYRSIQLALDAIEKRSSVTKQFVLERNQVEDIGMICGGNVTLYFRYIGGGDKAVIALCETALAQFDEQKTTWLITELTDDAGGEIGLYSEKLGAVGDISAEAASFISGQTGIFECAGKKYFSEKILTSGFVYIYGGGHVAQELVPVLAHIDFRCIVMDDRPEFTAPELFPGVVETKLVNMDDEENLSQVTSEDYIIILTRGHKYDQKVEELALRTPAKYIGVIGSAHKKAAVEKNIMEHGFTRADLDRVTSPIGLLSINAETPAEIAISIAAQLIGVRANVGVVS